MTDNNQIRTSKFLSLVLRHKPDTIGLTLDENGWATVIDLLEKINSNGFNLTFEELNIVVNNNDKMRFRFSSDMTKIKANQGHSIEVDLKLNEKIPPGILYHGTAERNLDSIKDKGLLKGQRHHVHLSSDKTTAKKVGQRYGKPVVLSVDTEQMHNEGIKFYQSDNGVWLTDTVPVKFIEI